MDQPPLSTVRAVAPDYFLDNLEQQVWQQLADALRQKENSFKTFTAATMTPEGWPDARTVVLRKVEAELRTLWFHTDVRAQKLIQLHHQNRALLLFWDAVEQVQLRLQVQTRIHTEGVEAEAQWDGLWEGSRKMYLSAYEPGSVLSAPYPGFPPELADKLPSREMSETGRPNFAAVECRVMSLDYLRLSRAGQTRARFIYHPQTVKGEWLAP